MQETSGAARRLDAADRERPDPLAYWHLQEITPLDAADPTYAPPAEADAGSRLASGWWLVPAIVLSVPAWLALAAALF